jgi:antitoxin component YwqK of YwqJK toxin-antitoxin module
MPPFRSSLLKSLPGFAALAVVLAAACLLGWAAWRRAGLLDESGTVTAEELHDDEWLGAHHDELLGGLLDLAEWDPVAPEVGKGEETSAPANIDGRRGVLWTGWYANGVKWYEHEYVEDKQHGKQVEWDERGQKVLEAHWRDGYLHGRRTRWLSSGQIAEDATYARCRLHGGYRTWHRGGQALVEAEFRDGLRQGPFACWYPNGTVCCRANFAEDRLDGVWQEWDAAGQTVRRKEYRGGVLVEESPAPSREPFAYPGALGSRDFALILAQGSDWHGYNTLRVNAAGRCEYRYFVASAHVEGGSVSNGPDWRRADFQLTGEEQRWLREAIGVADVFGHGDQYINKKIADGTQWVVRLRADGKAKQIYCSNQFPDALRKLSRTLRGQVMAPHQMEVVTATRFEGKAQSPAEEAWPEDPGN